MRYEHGRCIALVLATQESTKLAGAYGIAVTGTMTITSVLFYAVARERWHWSRARAGLLVGMFLTVDLAFFGSNLLKFFHGGWFPIAAGLSVFVVMSTWKRGATWRAQESARGRVDFDDFLVAMRHSQPTRVPGRAVFMTQDATGTPAVLLHHLKHNQVLHEQVVLLTIRTRNEPEVPPDCRVTVKQLEQGFWRVLADYGFMETPHVPEVMRRAAEAGLTPVRGRTSFYLGRETFIPAAKPTMPRWRAALFVFLSRNARPPTEYYGIPANEVVELGAQFQI